MSCLLFPGASSLCVQLKSGTISGEQRGGGGDGSEAVHSAGGEEQRHKQDTDERNQIKRDRQAGGWSTNWSGLKNFFIFLLWRAFSATVSGHVVLIDS